MRCTAHCRSFNPPCTLVGRENTQIGCSRAWWAAMVRAVNGYRDGWRGEGVVYIGRRNPKFNLAGSPLGNPFKIGVGGDREEVVAKYRRWLEQQVSEGLAGRSNTQFQHLMQLVRLAQPGKPELKLACYCKPLACHGDVVADWIHRLLESHQVSPS